jgi:hypothetical protein
MRQDYIDKRAQTLSGFCETLEESILRDLGNRIISIKKVMEDISYSLTFASQFRINDLSVLEDRKAKYLHHHKIANFLDDLKRSKSDIARKILDKQEEIIQNLIQKMTSKEVAKVSNISKSRCHCLFKGKWRC